jgi:hypothetical protein
VDEVIEVERITPRILKVKMGIRKKVGHIFSVYALQAGRLEREKEGFWSRLDDEVSQVIECELLFVAGDLNVHVGEVRAGFEEVMGIYGVRERKPGGRDDSVLLPGKRFATCEHDVQKGWGRK